MSNPTLIKSHTNDRRILISLIGVLLGLTILYQSRPFLDDAQFAWISIPVYAITPAAMIFFASVLTITLYRKKHYQSKAFLFAAIGSACWFIAEQLWQLYDHIWEGDPFPSEADIFYLGGYPFMTLFVMVSLKPVIKSVSRNVWLFAIGLSFSFLIPSILASYEWMFGEEAFDTAVALSYPIASAILVVPTIVGIMYLAKKGANFSWMIILFAFIIYGIADTFFLFLEIDEAYYDGHPVDLLWAYTYTMLAFAFYSRLKLAKLPTSESQAMFFSDNVKFETISKFGIPLTLAIVCMVILISITHSIFLETDEQLTTQNLMLGVVAMLAVFAIIVITINKNLSRLVTMRTSELVQQRDNLENLIEEKTNEVLKAERLSAIGELSGRLAHDLRNPLSVIKMSVDLIKQNPADSKLSDPTITKRIDLIEKSIDRISHQVDDVLGYVRNSPLKLTSTSIPNLIDDSLSKINVPTDVEINVSKKDLTIDCDPVKLDAVFINLIVNAIQAMPEGGKIIITMEEKDNLIILNFSDSGPGISEENIDKVFEPLFTTKQKGTGLGLASCKNIIEQHQGEISVKNNPTTFTIILPKTLSIEYAKIQS